LPALEVVKKYYEINFDEFAIVMFHPVTTEINEMQNYTRNFVKSLENDNHNYIVIYPNNDLGSQFIIDEYKKLNQNPRFRVFPSLRFEYFLTLLKNAQFIIGNSSAGIREAPYYGVPIINIGTRQQNRAVHADIINVDYDENSISRALKTIDSNQIIPSESDFGNGNSADLFLKSLENSDIWKINHQKQFRDI
jgi:UDP-N-acetylglucosamine 2-epimerase (hydrolysing)